MEEEFEVYKGARIVITLSRALCQAWALLYPGKTKILLGTWARFDRQAYSVINGEKRRGLRILEIGSDSLN